MPCLTLIYVGTRVCQNAKNSFFTWFDYIRKSEEKIHLFRVPCFAQLFSLLHRHEIGIPSLSSLLSSRIALHCIKSKFSVCSALITSTKREKEEEESSFLGEESVPLMLPQPNSISIPFPSSNNPLLTHSFFSHFSSSWRKKWRNKTGKGKGGLRNV